MINKHKVVCLTCHSSTPLCHAERSRSMNFMQSPFDSAQDDGFSNLLWLITYSHYKK
jgi:hypothetical protein